MALFSIKKTIVAGFVAALVIICILAGFTYSNMQETEKDNREVESILQSLRITESLYDNIQEIETGQRGYVIAGDKVFLTAYKTGLQQIGNDTLLLKSIKPVSENRAADIRHLLDLVAQKIAFADETIRLRDKEGFTAAETKVQLGGGKKLKESIQLITQKIESEDRVVLTKLSTHRAVTARQTTIFFFILAGLFIIFLALFFWLMRRDIRKRLRKELSVRVEENTIAFKDILDRISDGFMALDKNWNFVYINKASEETLSRSDLIGKNIWEEFPEAKGNEFYEGYHKAMKNQEYVYIEAYYPGFDAWFENHVYPSSHGVSIHSRNITEKKKIESKLQQAVERFNTVASATNDILWEADLRLKNIWWNDNFYEKFGYDKRDDFTAGDMWERLLHPDDKKRVVDNINFVLYNTTDISWIDEYRFIKADGTYADIYDRCYIMRDAEGKPYKVIGSMTDITMLIAERKRNEQLIRENEHQLKLIYNASGNVIFLIAIEPNRCYRFRSVNETFLKVTGLSEEQVIGTCVDKIIPPESYEMVRAKYEEAIRSGQPVQWEETSLYPTGVKTGMVTVSPVFNERGECTLLVGSVHDISERKKIEEEVRRSREELTLSVERFETIASATHDAIWEWNLESGELWANEVHQQLYGLTKADPVPRVEEWQSRIHPDDLNKTISAQDMALTSDINYWETEYRFRLANGSYVNLFDRCYIIRDRNKKPVRLTGSMIDITKRKQIENDLRESEAKYRSVIEQASDFIMITDLQGNFTDANSHFLNTFGYSKDEFTNLNVRNVIDPEDLKIKPVRFDLLAKGESILNERRMIDRNGNIIEVEANVKMLPDGRILAIARDIRDRNKAQAEIVKAKELADKLIDSLPGVFYFFDETGKFLRWNKQFEIATGYSAAEIADMKPQDFFATDTKDYISQRIMSVFENGYSDAEADFLTKNGERVPYYFSAMMLSYEGKACLLGSGIDISERRKAEEELRQSEQKYKLLFYHNPLPLWMATIPELDIVDVNESAIRQYGYTREEFLQLNARDLRPAEDVPHFLEEVGKMLPGINNTRRWRHRKKDGTIMHVEIFSHEVMYEGRKVWLGLSNDITVKVEAEELLRASEKKYKLLFENNPMPMWMLAIPSLDIIDVNDAAIRHYGYSRAEFLGLNATQIRPEEDIERFINIAKAESNGVRYSGTWRHKKKDGTLIDVEIISHDIDYGDMPARLILANDITEKVKAETLLKKSFEDIRQLTEHLQTIREEERAHIAREIHDELGQQLTVLKMDVSWLNKKIMGDAAVKEKLQELTTMLDGTVRTVRRISSELRPSLLDDLGLIAAIDWHLKEFEKRTGILTEFDEPVLGLNIAQNVTTGLFRIFQESLTNVTRHADADKVKVSLQQLNGTLILQIQDDGKGFDKEKQANKRTLGILGMKERTEMMGGRYEISSQPGNGTTVVVSIPNNPG